MEMDFNNFSFFALINSPDKKAKDKQKDLENRIFRFDLTVEALSKLKIIIKKQFNNFNKLSKIDFTQDPHHYLQDDELFTIQNVSHLSPLFNAVQRQPNISRLDIKKLLAGEIFIKALFYYVEINSEPQIILQYFTGHHFINRGFNLVVDEDTQNNVSDTFDKSLIILPASIVGVVDNMSTSYDVVFESYRNMNSILDLSEYYRIATEAELETFLQYSNFNILKEDFLKLTKAQSVRRKIAEIDDSKILENYSHSEIAKKYHKETGINLQLANNHIVLPTDKDSFKILIDFLNEDYFKGSITDKPYVASGKSEK